MEDLWKPCPRRGRRTSKPHACGRNGEASLFVIPRIQEAGEDRDYKASNYIVFRDKQLSSDALVRYFRDTAGSLRQSIDRSVYAMNNWVQTFYQHL